MQSFWDAQKSIFLLPSTCSDLIYRWRQNYKKRESRKNTKYMWNHFLMYSDVFTILVNDVFSSCSCVTRLVFKDFKKISMEISGGISGRKIRSESSFDATSRIWLHKILLNKDTALYDQHGDEEEGDCNYLTSIRSMRALLANPPKAAKQIMMMAWWPRWWS